MKQGGLFGHLKMDDQAKQKNQELINRMNNPKKARSKVTVNKMHAEANRIAARVQIIEQKAEQFSPEIKALRSHIPSELIDTEERFMQYIDRCLENGIVHLDTEGSGLDAIDDFTCGVCLWTPNETRMYAPFLHTDFNKKRREDIPQISIECMREQMERFVQASWNGTLYITLGNSKYDMRIMKNTLKLSNYIKPFWDVIFAGSFLNENEPHGLKYLWGKYCNGGDKGQSYQDLFEKIGFNWFTPSKVFEYAAFDPVMTAEVFEFQRPYLDGTSSQCLSQNLVETSNLYRKEMDLIPYLAAMEDTGVSIDKELGAKLSTTYKKRLDKVQKETSDIIKQFDLSKLPPELRGKLSNPINIGSPDQLGIVLYDVLGLSHTVKKEKDRATGEEVIQNLKTRYLEHEKMLQGVLEYRGLNKLLSTYIEKMPRIVKEKTGRLHGQFNQYGAKTGRFSSKDPNLQNIPARNKEIRPMFRATEGYYLVSGDYSQQEPRVLAFVSQDEGMIQAYEEGKDLYAWIASQVYRLPYDECLEKYPGTENVNPDGKKRRQSMKEIVLGIMYGRGAKSIAEKLGIDKSEAQGYVDMFFDTFPKVKEYVDSMIEFCRLNGYVTTVWGRKRRLPDINLEKYEIKPKKGFEMSSLVRDQIYSDMNNAWGKQQKKVKSEWARRGYLIKDNGGFIADAERQTINSIIQGTSADITKLAMLKLGQDQELRQLGFRMLLTVHDEIIGEAPKENAKRAADRMCKLMIEAAAEKITVPMKVDAEITECWYGKDLYDKIS